MSTGTLNTDFTETEINTLTKKLIFQGKMGALNIENLKAGFSTLDLNCRHMDVKIHTDKASGFTISGETNYTDLHLPKQIKKEKDGYTGYKISGGSGVSSIRLDCSYGDVRID